jgi:hypothetical protein
MRWAFVARMSAARFSQYRLDDAAHPNCNTREDCNIQKGHNMRHGTPHDGATEPGQHKHDPHDDDMADDIPASLIGR